VTTVGRRRGILVGIIRGGRNGARGVRSQLLTTSPKRAANRARLEQFHARGLLLLAGPLLDPMDGSAMGIFTSRQATEEFIRGDPFVLHGVVCSWRVRPGDEFLTGPDDRTVSGDGGERGAAAASR
jgi:uncharacterized protein